MKLIYGGLSQYIKINGVKVALAPRGKPPFTVEVMIFEEDTNLILTADPVIQYKEEHPIRLMTGIMKAKRHLPGSLVINKSSWYGVVIDLDEEMICRPKNISNVYSQLFERLQKEKIKTAGIHLLGCTHGNILLDEALNLFSEGLNSVALNYPKSIWLIVPENDIRSARKYLACKM